jgi:hypothetical protein
MGREIFTYDMGQRNGQHKVRKMRSCVCFFVRRGCAQFVPDSLSSVLLDVLHVGHNLEKQNTSHTQDGGRAKQLSCTHLTAP